MAGMDQEQMMQMVGDMAGKLVMGQLQQEEKKVDDMLDTLENMDDDDMEKLREARKRRLMKEAAERQRLKSQGHGEYREISGEKEFFSEVKNAPCAAVHFYRPATFRCAIVDKHMSRCAPKYVGCKFIKINAEKCPYLCEKLHIWCLPSIVLIKDGKTEHTCVGFNDFGGDDDFSDEMFEFALGEKGVIKYKGPHPGDVSKSKSHLSRQSKSSIRQKEYDSDDY